MKAVASYEQNSIAQLINFFKEENERARQHELELFNLIFQQGSANNCPNHSAMQNAHGLEPEYQRMQNHHSNTTIGNHHQTFFRYFPDESMFTPWLPPAGSENSFSQDRDIERSFLQL